MDALRAGDRKALEGLYRANQQGLHAFVDRIVSDRAVAEEIVQDVFVSLWRHREKLQLRGTLKAYLYAAARNHALNHLKRQKIARRWWQRGAEASADDTGEARNDPAAFRELRERVESAIAALPERTRLVFTLSRNEGLTYPEIAKALEISVKTVESQMSRALRLLRDDLAPFLNDESPE